MPCQLVSKCWGSRLGKVPRQANHFDNYRKEAERLLLWSTIQMEKPLSSLTHDDWLIYQAFRCRLMKQPRYCYLIANRTWETST
jgi:hypothetical protein